MIDRPAPASFESYPSIMSTRNQRPPGGLGGQELRGPRALRAMAHPVRLRIMEELARTGQATATELSGRIGESAANCSWHLRQLAQYGFIEEAGGGIGRRRPWKVVVPPSAPAWPDGTATEFATDVATEVILGRELAAYQRWRAARHGAPRAWQDAAFLTQSWYWLTADELAGFRADYQRLIQRHLARRERDRADPARRPPDAQLVRVVAWAIPAGPAGAGTAPTARS
jgi:hypothetical protein